MAGKRIAALLAVLALLVPLSVTAAGFEGAARDEDGRFVNETGPLAHGSFLGVRFPFFLRRPFPFPAVPPLASKPALVFFTPGVVFAVVNTAV